MTYTVFGTLYNRYVLQLRGIDQIPQFSIESMRYHGSEALDWIRDIIAGLDIGGRTNGGTPYGGFPSGGPRTPNPVSHHSQTSEPPGDPEETGGLSNSNKASPFQRMEINPVSHQSQVIAQSLSFSTAASPPPSQFRYHTHDLPPQNHRSPIDKQRSTKETRDFMLGGDDDAEELADVSTHLGHTPTPRVSPPSETTLNNGTTASSADVAAAARGDVEGGEHVRL